MRGLGRLTRENWNQVLLEELGTADRAAEFEKIWCGRDLDITDCGWGDTPDDNIFTRMRDRMNHTFGKQKVDEVLRRFRELLGEDDEQAQDSS